MKKFLLILLIYVNNLSAQVCIPNTSSLSFDGASSYVSFPASSVLDISDVITIEAWINSNAWGFSSAQNTIVCKHGWFAGEEGYVLRAGGTGELSFNIAGTDLSSITQWTEVISGTNALQLNTWHHVAGTFDGLELKIYIDGVLSGTTPFVGTINPSVDYNIHIGRLADENQFETRYWSGMIDEVRVWHRALTQSEIQSNMNKHIDPSAVTDLVAYWRLNDISGSNVADLSPTGLMGTVYGATFVNDVPFNDGPPVPTITSGGPYLYSSSTTNNQWNLNGVPIPGQNFLSIVPQVNGSYTVTVTDSNGCSVTSAPYIETLAGVENISGNNKIKIQNLSEGLYQLSCLDGSVNDLKVYDVKGQIVLKKSLPEGKEIIDLRSFNSGVYVVFVSSGQNTYQLKIVL
jgi:hypothetical protein